MNMHMYSLVSVGLLVGLAACRVCALRALVSGSFLPEIHIMYEHKHVIVDYIASAHNTLAASPISYSLYRG